MGLCLTNEVGAARGAGERKTDMNENRRVIGSLPPVIGFLVNGNSGGCLAALVCLIWLLGSPELFAQAHVTQNRSASFRVASASNLRFFEGLRERNLFQLAEMLCQRELNRSDISGQAQLFYRIELARTYAAHAQTVPIDQADALWESAYATLKPQPDEKNSERVSLLDVETGILRAEQAGQLFWIAIAEPDDEALKARFLKVAQQANSELESASQIVSRFLKRPAQSSAETVILENRLTANRLSEIQVTHARLFLQVAQVQQQDVPERTAAVERARALASPLAKKQTNRFWEQSARLVLLSAARIQNDQAELDRLYRSLNRPGIDLQIRNQATAEYARFLLAENRTTEAAEMILNYGRESGALSAELEGLRLEALLKMAVVVRQTGEARLADELENEVQHRLEKLEAKGENYYLWRIRKLQQHYQLEQRFGPSISRKLLQARGAVQREEWDAAQTGYDAAVKLALQESRGKLLIELGREAAAVDFRIRDYQHAENLLKTIWESSPLLPGMESIHLLWIYALGRDYISNPTQQKVTRYLEALQQHRQRYKDRTTSIEATWLLAELQFARMQVTRALDLYRKIPQTDSRYLAAQIRVVQCYQWILQRVRELGQPSLDWQNRAVEFALEKQNSWKNREIQQPEQAELLLATSRVLLDARAQQPALLQRDMQRILNVSRTAIDKSRDDPETLRKWEKVFHSARALEGILLVSRGEVDQARKLFTSENSSLGTAEDRLFMARQLASLGGETPRVRQIVAELLLLLTDELKTGSDAYKRLSRQQAIEIRELRAEAFANSGQTTKAVALYEQLLQEAPENRNYLNRLSTLLEMCNNRKHWEKAYALWKGRVGKEKQGTEAWLEARYHLAKAGMNLDRLEEARKIVQVTLLLYPNIGSKDLQDRYRKLAEQLKQ